MSNGIISKEDAERIVIVYQPQKLFQPMTESADSFSRMHESQPSAFRMNEIIQTRIGVAEKNRQNQEEVAERKALEKLKEIQEAAYKEAYTLGLDEGRKEAFTKHEGDIKVGVENLNALIKTLSTIKVDLFLYNESHIVKLLYYLASRLAMRDIDANPEAIVPVLRQILERSQGDEKVNIKLSPEDFEFLSESNKFLQLKINALENAHLEKVEGVKRGGCVVETNYGQVDATLEVRVNRMWETVHQTAPKPKDKFEA